LLGLSYANLGRHAEAATAFARAIELNPTNADLRGGRVEALVRAAGGQVTAEAAAAIEEGLTLAPQNPQLRYFKGLSAEQAGDKKAAYALWSDIAKNDDPQEPWADELRQHLSVLGRELGVTGASQASPTAPGSAAAMMEFLQARERSELPGRSEAGLPADPNAGGESPVPADNAAMIRSMVENLASRLEQSPNDVDGWVKLMRSRVVLGEQELARQALERALRASGDDAQAREKVMAAAGQLGIR
jgi:cytochrome c-type biogenesis protein CcmH